MSHPPAAEGNNPDAGMHLPHGSWWPFWLAVSVSLLGLGIIAMGQSLQLSDPFAPHVASPFAMAMLGIGLAATVGSLVGWFVQDYHWWNQKLGTGTHIPKAGALLFIASEVFLFGALFTNYFTFEHLSTNSGLGWPDGNPPTLLLSNAGILKVAIFSVFLFASSGTVHLAEHHIKKGNHSKFVVWWGVTILLGLIFLGGQVMEYMELIHEGHTLGSSQFMTAFFILTGTHGLHVFAGLVMLFVMWVRALKGQFTAERHAGPQVASMYWHFVDIVWVFVFVIVYLFNMTGA
jgi:cytochrome c oxidase subunit III